MKLIFLVTALMCFTSCSSIAETHEYGIEESERVDLDLSKYDSELLRMKDEFNSIPIDTNDKVWVSSKISHMVKIDQYMRKYLSTPYDNNYSPEEQKYFQRKFMPRFSSLDKENTTELKQLLVIYEWFKISNFSEQTDKDAWLLVQHADLDIKFQKEILLILKKLYLQGETNKRNYAYLYDRVKSGEKKLQLYGTQGKCVGVGKWEMGTI